MKQITWLLLITLISAGAFSQDTSFRKSLKVDSVAGVIVMMNKLGKTLSRRGTAIYSDGKIFKLDCPHCYWKPDTAKWYLFVPDDKLY